MMLLTITTGQSRKALSWKPETLTWEALVQRLSTARRTGETVLQYQAMTVEERSAAKDVGGFVGGRLRGERRKAEAVLGRQIMVLDADYAPADFKDAVCGWAVPWACCAHTTHSHTPEKPRYRLILPLTREVSADEYEACARWVSAEIGMEYFDDTTYEPCRLMYWPSCPSDGEFIAWEQKGDWLNPDWVLSQYADWRDTTSWPRTDKAVRQLAESAKKQGDPTQKPGIVGAFCRVYDVPAAIERYLPEVYRDDGNGRYTYVKGSTAQGMVLFDDGQFCRSYHSTDPAGGRLINSFDLVRIHLYGALDDEVDEDTPVNQRPSYQGMRTLCREDEAVWAELGGSSPEDDFAEGEEDEPEITNKGTATDQDSALSFEEFARPILRYSASLGWIAWDGRRWVPGADDRARKTVMQYNNTVLAMAQTETDEERRKAKLKHAMKLRSTGAISAMLVNAQALLRDEDPWDTNPWLLNTPKGIVNLQDGTLMRHTPAQRMTAMTACACERGEAPMWHKFLREVTGEDKDLENYLQDVLGMALVGQVYNEGMVVVTGSGGNGKSTFFGACARVLGTYADSIRPELLLSRANGQEAFGIDCVRGKRLVLAGETDEGAALSEATMKRLTSRDEISANPKYKQPFTFTPSHTLILHTNHLPKVRHMDGGIARRMAIVVFPYTPKPEHIIVDLMEQLVAREGDAILAWMVDGAVRFWKRNCMLPKPKCVEEATAKYLGDNDWLKEFLEDCCEVGDNQEARGGELYERYRSWCMETGERFPKRARDFAQALESKGFQRVRKSAGVIWEGLKLNSEFL